MQQELQQIREWFNLVSLDKYTTNQSVKSPTRPEYIQSKYPFACKDFLNDLYWNKEYGLKEIASLLGITYSKTRTLFTLAGIEHRKGRGVITSRLKKSRSDRALDNNPWTDWPTKNPGLAKRNGRGIQGVYEGKWLRSTYEFIYAKWLDRTNQTWKYEESQYQTPFGGYRPDFFIYKDSKLSAIVEIKGLWYSTSEERIKKTNFLKQTLDIPVSIITDVTPYIEAGSNYEKEKLIWKAISKSSK